MSDPHAIATHEQLRAVIPEPSAKVAAKVVSHLGALEREFITCSPMLMLSTAGRDGAVTVSPKGDGPGFVRIEDDRTLVIPERPGNQLAFGLRNVIDNPHIGLLFLIPGSSETFRVDGRAELTRDPALLESLAARGKHAVLAMRVHVERCFFHCGKAFIRSGLWQADAWPEPFRFSWGDWARQWYELDAEAAAEVDADIARDQRDNL